VFRIPHLYWGLSADIPQAVNALEGRMFNGNTISARFFDVEKFEGGIFE